MDKGILEQTRHLLEELHPEIDFNVDNCLVDKGVLDSFDMVELVSELNMMFNVRINALHLTKENFNTIEAIAELVMRLQNQGVEQ